MERHNSDLNNTWPSFGTNEFRNFFRNNYISNEGKSRFLGICNGNFYLIIIFAIAISAPIIIASQITEFRLSYLLLFPFYFIVCNLFEYILHRYPMHQKIKYFEFLFEHVTIHHSFYHQRFNYFKQPKDYMAVFLPLLYFAFISVVFLMCALVVYFISDLNHALFFEVTIYSYYLMYETLHFSYHSPKESFIGRIPFIRSLAKFHLRHHHTELMSKYNFNITIPIFDYIFNTMCESEPIIENDPTLQQSFLNFKKNESPPNF